MTAIDRAIATVMRRPSLYAAEPGSLLRQDFRIGHIYPALEAQAEPIVVEGTFGPEWGISEVVGPLVSCSWVEDEVVPEAHREVVQEHVDRCAQIKGLGSITVRYFGPVKRGHAPDFANRRSGPGMIPTGYVPPDQEMTLGLNASMRGDAVVTTIAHEIEHLDQRRRIRELQAELAMLQSLDVREEQADQFAAWYWTYEVAV